ncbi:hypothetical protein AKJ16_DCAP03843 [Drosera capensis]
MVAFSLCIESIAGPFYPYHTFIFAFEFGTLQSLSLKPLPSWASDVRFLPLCILRELCYSNHFKCNQRNPLC